MNIFEVKTVKFDFSAYDTDGNEQTFSVSVNSECVIFRISNQLSLSRDSEDIFELMDKYRNNYGSGCPMEEREYYKLFMNLTANTSIENMVRAFAVASGYLHWREADVDKEFWINDRIETMEKYFPGNVLIDWTGDTNVQPYMYFLPKDMIEKNTENIEKLYKAAILQKLEVPISNDQSLLYYYLPFKYTEITFINDNELKLFWSTLVKSVNKRILKFTGGK